MTGDERINEELRYAKGKAKFAEYSVPIDQRPKFQYDSDDLCFNAMHALSKVANAYVGGSVPDKNDLAELQRAAFFYDAASRSDDHQQCRDGFWLLAMATYFLLGNFGSAVASSKYIDDPAWYGQMGKKFYVLAKYLLGGKVELSDIDAPQLVGYLRGSDISPKDVIAEAHRKYINDDNAEDHFFGKVCFAATEVALEFASRNLLPEFSKLDVQKWKPYLSSKSGCRLLWQAQKYIAEAGVLAGNSMFVQLPTGSGKTRGIQLIIRARILAGSCNKAIVVAPLRALCTEITRDLTQDISDIAEIKQSTDAYEMDTWLLEDTAGPQVLVFTPEKLEYVERHGGNLIATADLFVFDEVQLIDSPHRGPAYELLIAEMKLRHQDAQLIMLSAVVSNPNEISEWAIGNPDSYISGKDILRSNKTLGRTYSAEGSKAKIVFDYFEHGQMYEFNIYIDINEQQLKLHKRECKERYFPERLEKKDPNDLGEIKPRELAIYISEIVIKHGAIAIYIPKAAYVATLFSRLEELGERECLLPNLKNSFDSEEGKRIIRLADKHYGMAGDPFRAGILFGILPHYSGLQGCLRQVVEDELITGKFKCIACTSTLAEGVNMPIRYLIVTGVNQDGGQIKTRNFQNLIGRTARPGKYSEGSILITDHAISDRHKRQIYNRLLDQDNIEACESAISHLFADVRKNARGSADDAVISGNEIMDCVLEGLESRDVSVALESCLVRRGFDITDRKCRENITNRLEAINAIETYVAAMIESATDEVDAVRLCTGTFAYSMADDAEQENMIKLFQAVYDAVKSADTRLPAAVYAKTHMGIAKTEALERWLAGEDGIALMNASTNAERIVLICKAYQECGYTSGSVMNGTMLAELADMWIDGKNLAEILAAYSWGKGLKMYQLERIISRDLHYGLANFISSTVDVLEGVSGNEVPERLIESLMLLQEEVKYGVDSPLGCAICGEIFEDRMVAGDLVGILGHPEMKLRSDLKRLCAIHDEEVIRYLNDLPAYFRRRYSAWKER